MNLFDLFAKISLDTSEYETGVKNAAQDGKALSGSLKNDLTKAADLGAKGLKVMTGVAVAAGGSLVALCGPTRE